eukprot:364686-Chlamydomonas_euryale.AAC.9
MSTLTVCQCGCSWLIPVQIPATGLIKYVMSPASPQLRRSNTLWALQVCTRANHVIHAHVPPNPYSANKMQTTLACCLAHGPPSTSPQQYQRDILCGSQVIEVGGLPMLVQLARSAPDPAARRAAVEALAPMCRYGEPPTQVMIMWSRGGVGMGSRAPD